MQLQPPADRPPALPRRHGAISACQPRLAKNRRTCGTSRAANFSSCIMMTCTSCSHCGLASISTLMLCQAVTLTVATQSDPSASRLSFLTFLLGKKGAASAHSTRLAMAAFPPPSAGCARPGVLTVVSPCRSAPAGVLTVVSPSADSFSPAAASSASSRSALRIRQPAAACRLLSPARPAGTMLNLPS